MKVWKGYKVKLYPTSSQEERLLQIAGACRFVYNYFLDRKASQFEHTGTDLGYRDMGRELIKIRHELPWLGQSPASALDQSLRNLDKAYRNFFKKRSEHPRLKKKDGVQTIRKSHGWTIRGNRIGAFAGLRLKFRGTFPAKPSAMLTLSRDSCGTWWASTHEEIEVAPVQLQDKVLGIDLGINDLAITSDGEKFGNPRFLNGLGKRLRHASQALSRKAKGSRGRAKAKLELARLHRKVAFRRKNHLHHVSKAVIGKNHAVIALEDLVVKNMMQNRSLARSISDVAWTELVRQLTYKQSAVGGKVVKIDRFFPSTKTCSNCQAVASSIPLSVREWTCEACGSHHDRDRNAALNIKAVAERLCVEALPEPKKRRRLRAIPMYLWSSNSLRPDSMTMEEASGGL